MDQNASSELSLPSSDETPNVPRNVPPPQVDGGLPPIVPQNVPPPPGGETPLVRLTFIDSLSPRLLIPFRWVYLALLLYYMHFNSDKRNPLTKPNQAGEWPRYGNRNIITVHNNLTDGAIENLYMFYGLAMPVCDGFSDEDRRKFRLMKLKDYLGSKVLDPLLIVRGEGQASNHDYQIMEYNHPQQMRNLGHTRREDPISVLRPYHRLSFLIPDHIDGLERLSVQQKKDLLLAFNVYPNDIPEPELLDRIFAVFGLRNYFQIITSVG